MEIEVKYSPVSSAQAQALFADDVLSIPAGECTCLQMRTVYYDDTLHRLSGNGWTLRLRQENEKSICTFKARVSRLARLELETEAADIQQGARVLAKHPEMPAAAAQVLEDGSFFPTCGAEFVRQVQLRRRGETTFALSWDQGTLWREQLREPFTEAELELASGEEQALETLAEEYRRKHGLTVCKDSKQQRARRLGRESAV